MLGPWREIGKASKCSLWGQGVGGAIHQCVACEQEVYIPVYLFVVVVSRQNRDLRGAICHSRGPHARKWYISKVLGGRERLTNKGAAETDGISDEWNAKVQELQRDVKWFHLGYFIWNPRYLWSLFQSKGNEGPIRLSNSPRVTHLAAQIGN